MNNLQEKVIRAMVDMYGFYSIEELSEMTEISISSIKRSLKDITKFIEDYDGKLLRVPKKGICMVVTDQQRENILEALDSYANGNPESFYYRKNYILDILFNYPANYTVQLFSEELCVSRKMIEKDLKMIEEYLATFHLELSKVQNQGISIVGREFDIRQAIVDTQNKKYWKHTYILNEKNFYKRNIIQMINEVIRSFVLPKEQWSWKRHTSIIWSLFIGFEKFSEMKNSRP